MDFRYRTFQSRVDAVELAGAFVEARQELLFPAAAMATAGAGAVREVFTGEQVATFEELVQLLTRHEVMPSDLVFSNGQWVTFADSPDFFEVCAGLVDVKARALKVKAAAVGIGVFILVSVTVLLRVLSAR